MIVKVLFTIMLRILLQVLMFTFLFCRVNPMESRLVDAVHRQIRALSYPEDSEMGLFFALAIPLDDPVSTKSISVAFFFEANYELPNDITDFSPNSKVNDRKRRSIDRRTVYSVLEAKFESLGFPGRECLLRSICETRRNPIHLNNGVLGDLLRIIFTPSSSYDEGLPVEFFNAEQENVTIECGTTYFRCPFGIYDYITGVYE